VLISVICGKNKLQQLNIRNKGIRTGFLFENKTENELVRSLYKTQMGEKSSGATNKVWT